jgi:hypothetical protein
MNGESEIGSTWASLLVVSFAIGCGGEVHHASSTDGGSPSGSGGAHSLRFPPQAALSFAIDPAPGKVCNETNPTLGFPSQEDANVLAELNCDLSRGCKPDDFVVVAGKQGATVACSVSPQGDNFALQLTLDVDGSATNEPSVHFNLAGLSSSTGGMVSIDESNSIAGGGGRQVDCALTISPPFGVVAKGKIWGEFECDAFGNPADLGDTGCDVQGQLLFENCED